MPFQTHLFLLFLAGPEEKHKHRETYLQNTFQSQLQFQMNSIRIPGTVSDGMF